LKVSAQSPSTNAAGAPNTGAMAGVVRRNAKAKSLRAVLTNLKPNAPILVGLAIAITLWGFGYRLSQYQVHPPAAAQAAQAKLCVEPRNPALAAASQLKTSQQLVVEAPVVPVSVIPEQFTDRGPIHTDPERTYRSISFHFLIPFRSPPPQRFSLA
jgi:hypothetical protein